MLILGEDMHFIIYEDETTYINRYKQIIHKVMGMSNINYKIINITRYEEDKFKKITSYEGNKIYLIDIEVPNKNGIDLARDIRKSGDWISPIIVITGYDEFRNIGYMSKILMLDFISKKDDIERSLYNDLTIALEMAKTKPSLCFTSKGEIYQIPYQDILYIEKNINDNYATIITKNKNYIIRKTINKLAEELNNEYYFIKTHRSFLVNIKNIKSINLDYSSIDFGNGKRAMISRGNKKKLKERMTILNDNSKLQC